MRTIFPLLQVLIYFLCINYLASLYAKEEAKNNSKAIKVFKYLANSSSLSTIDPLFSGDIYSSKVILSIYDTLYEYKYLDPSFSLKPNLADGHPFISKDKLTYKIKIKKGVFFSDDICFPKSEGRELLADDFIYSIKRIYDPKNISTAKWYWNDKIQGLQEWIVKGGKYDQEISGLKAIDKYTIQIILKKPYPMLTNTLTMPFTSVVPKEAVEKYGKKLSHYAVGSGPWLLESYSSTKIILKKNPKYRKEFINLKELGFDSSIHGAYNLGEIEGKRVPLLDKVEINFIQGASTRWFALLKSNEVDLGYLSGKYVDLALATKDPFTLKAKYRKRFFIYNENTFSYQYFAFNMNHSNFGYHKDEKENERRRGLRKAIHYSIDWDDYLSKRFAGVGTVFSGIIPPKLDSFNKDFSLENKGKNIKKAKELLKKYNWNEENLPDIFYTGLSNVSSKQDFFQFQTWLYDIGYPKSKVKSIFFNTFPEMLKKVRSNTLPNFLNISWHMDFPDVVDILQLFYSPYKSPGANLSNYANPTFDNLFEKISLLSSGVEKEKLVQKANEIVTYDSPISTGISPSMLYMWNRNFIMIPSYRINYFKYVYHK